MAAENYFAIKKKQRHILIIILTFVGLWTHGSATHMDLGMCIAFNTPNLGEAVVFLTKRDLREILTRMHQQSLEKLK